MMWDPHPTTLQAAQALLSKLVDTVFCGRKYHPLLPCRRNTYSGKLYKEDANILAWDLLNEPRYTSGGTSAVQNWVDMFAPFIKSQDPNHMVSGAGFQHILNS